MNMYINVGCQSAEEIRWVFDDNSKIILVKTSYKPMLLVLIRIASLR